MAGKMIFIIEVSEDGKTSYCRVPDNLTGIFSTPKRYYGEFKGPHEPNQALSKIAGEICSALFCNSHGEITPGMIGLGILRESAFPPVNRTRIETGGTGLDLVESEGAERVVRSTVKLSD